MFFTFALLSFFTIVQPTVDNSPLAWCPDSAFVTIRNSASSAQSSVLTKASSKRSGTIPELNGCTIVSVPAPKSSGNACAFGSSQLTLEAGELKVTPWAPLFKYEAIEIRPKTTLVKAGEVYKPTTNPGKFRQANEASYPVILESVGAPAKNIHFDFICQ